MTDYPIDYRNWFNNIRSQLSDCFEMIEFFGYHGWKKLPEGKLIEVDVYTSSGKTGKIYSKNNKKKVSLLIKAYASPDYSCGGISGFTYKPYNPIKTKQAAYIKFDKHCFGYAICYKQPKF